MTNYPWFNSKEDFYSMVALSDDKMGYGSLTFEEWLKEAELALKQKRDLGQTPSPIKVTPIAFKEWCANNGYIPSKDALSRYMTEIG